MGGQANKACKVMLVHTLMMWSAKKSLMRHYLCLAGLRTKPCSNQRSHMLHQKPRTGAALLAKKHCRVGSMDNTAPLVAHRKKSRSTHCSVLDTSSQHATPTQWHSHA